VKCVIGFSRFVKISYDRRPIEMVEMDHYLQFLA